jgi:DNA-binding NarL/FixJ family response regulator
VIGKAPSGNDALEQIKKLRPEIALIDIGMPDKDGIELTQALRQDAPNVKVIILGMIDLTEEIMQCIEAGAAGYVLKEASFEYLVETIQSVHRGESFCSPQLTASLFSRIAELASEKIPTSQNDIKLTARELQVIHLIAEGLPNKAIAQRLFIETQTVKNHVHNILDKLQLQNRLQAVQYARDKNLLEKKY